MDHPYCLRIRVHRMHHLRHFRRHLIRSLFRVIFRLLIQLGCFKQRFGLEFDARHLESDVIQRQLRLSGN